MEMTAFCKLINFNISTMTKRTSQNPYLLFLAIVLGLVGAAFLILYMTSVFANPDSGDAPVAYWRFDEGYGTTTYDDSTNDNDGTINGAAWKPEDMCKSGKCLYFGGNAFVSINSNFT